MRKATSKLLATLTLFGASAAAVASPFGPHGVFTTGGSNDPGNVGLGIPSYPYYLTRSDTTTGAYDPAPGFQGSVFSLTGSGPFGVELGLDGDAYIAERNAGVIGRVDLDTAAHSNFITGVPTPLYVTIHHGNGDYYVSSDGGRNILRYDSTGAPKPSAGHGGAVFSDVINSPAGSQPIELGVSPDGTKLFAAYEGNVAAQGFLGVHDYDTGVLINSVTLGFNAWGVQPLSNDVVLVALLGAEKIVKVDFSTVVPTVTDFVTAGQGGLVTPRGMTIGLLDGDLYVADRSGLKVRRYDISTGVAINDPAPGRSGADFSQGYTYPGGLDFPGDVIAIPEPASLALLALGGLTMLRRKRA